MEKILNQFLLPDIIHHVLYDYLLPTEQFNIVVNQLKKDVKNPDMYLYLFHEENNKLSWSKLSYYPHCKENITDVIENHILKRSLKKTI